MTSAVRPAALRVIRGVLLAAVAVGLLVMHTQLTQPPAPAPAAAVHVVDLSPGDMAGHAPSSGMPAMPGHGMHAEGLCLAVLTGGETPLSLLLLLTGLLLAGARVGRCRHRLLRRLAGLARAPTRPARCWTRTVVDLCLLRI